ncbi:protein-disulfide reductase DsbD domain-containing protein [Vannielia litorea]|uniref:Disulphide bond corrector protein DsbC n=1 Tax=Vannielia litorea TaxID=1217970 RepID=A0A1N6HCP2_9RHOB|nr:protein-disulfide reductase DsbD domain-containing protein [Vannielia litorea]SIO17536.1 Disulphide bond corrector protein DsbC [Vannielia litorea]
MKIFLAALLSLALLAPATAGTYGLTPGEVVRAEVLPGWVTPRGTRMAALRLTLAPGWKTYWRAPGETGIPPSFDWTGSRNLARVTLHWPSPRVFDEGGVRTIGYKHELVLPIEITPATPGAPVELVANVDLGVCEHICVPASLSFTAALAGKGAPDPAIDAALKARPISAREAGLSGVTCVVDPISDGVRVTARIPSERIGGRTVAVIEPGNPRVWASETETRREGPALLASADLVPPKGQVMALSRKTLRVTLMGEGRAIDIQGCPSP